MTFLFKYKKIMVDSKVKYWTEMLDYDFETALAILKSGRYL